MAAPRIGITRSLAPSLPVETVPFSYQKYHDRVREAGGEPVDLHPAMTAAAEQLLMDLDGVIISGGPDINPSRYDQEPHPETAGISDARDGLEIGLIQAAMARDLPVFCICRGHQALNVALGGPLLQHIDGDGHRALEGGAGDSRWHDIEVRAGTRLSALIGAGTIRTNSRHHQAVLPEALGDGLVISAMSPDGLVEGMESPAHRWVVGVQWHPERDEVEEPFRPLFRDFLDAAARSRQATPARG